MTDDLHVLQLASSDESYFRQQVETLERRGIQSTSIVVPGVVAGNNARGVREYVNFYSKVLGEARNEYDLVHVNYGLIGPFGLAQPKRPVVLSLWGSEVMGFSKRLDRITRFAARRSDAVIAPSKAVSQHLDCDHIVVPYGINLSRFRPIDRAEAREYLGWQADELIIVFPYDPQRTVKNFPLARRVVDKAGVDVELRIVMGRPYEDMPFVMNAADVVLVTSERESGPMVVREAAACNVPVVSTDVGFVTETLENVTNSYVCRSEPELVRGLEAAIRSSGRSNGRDSIEGLDVDDMADQLITVYDAVLST